MNDNFKVSKRIHTIAATQQGDRGTKAVIIFVTSSFLNENFILLILAFLKCPLPLWFTFLLNDLFFILTE